MRVDIYISEKFNISRSKVKDLITRNKVLIDGKFINKASMNVEPHCNVEIQNYDTIYVSRAGNKLEAAIRRFNINVSGKIALDIGSSTGGFTQCLLRFDAKNVYSVDVGTEQMDPDLRKNPKIYLYEKTDIRDFSRLNLKFDIIVCDVSFISVEKIIQDIRKMCKINSDIIILIKPQFEVGKESISKRGIVKDLKNQLKAVNKVKNIFLMNDFKFCDIIESPIKGKSGNSEFLAYFTF